MIYDVSLLVMKMRIEDCMKIDAELLSTFNWGLVANFRDELKQTFFILSLL